MKYYCPILYLIIVVPTSQHETPVTLNVYDRVKVLERQLKEQINQPKAFERILPIDVEENYEYIDDKDGPITPIMDFDIRKKHERFKLKEIKSTRKMATKKDSLIMRERKNVARNRKHKSSSSQPQQVDSFYRRLLTRLDEPIEWIHCQDLVTPFFNGHKNDISVTKRLTHNDHDVARFIQLLRLNTTGFQKEEIYSVLYQLSNMQLKLFQWDASAMNLLFTALSGVPFHGFKELSNGIKGLLEKWHMDISNTTNLLKQARMFRPPCVKVSELEGSTKTSPAMRYSKSTTPKRICSTPGSDDDDCDQY